MGLAVVERRAGTLVWVRSKSNGSWWPGIVADPTEVSTCHVISSRDEAPVMLLGTTYNPPLEWFNLEKSRRIKAFRCEEFNDCIRKVESYQDKYPKGTTKYTHRDDAIRQALQLEDEMLKIFKKRKAIGEGQAGIVCKAKRSRRVYLPAETDCFSGPPQSNLTKCGTSFKQTNSVSSKRGSYGPNAAQGSKVSAVDTLMATLLSQLNEYSGEATNTNAEQNPEFKDSTKVPPCYVVAATHGAQEEKIKRNQKISNVPNSLEPMLNLESVSKLEDSSKVPPCHVVSTEHWAQEEKMNRKQKPSKVWNSLKPLLNPKSVSKTRNGTLYNSRPWCSSELATKREDHVAAAKHLAQEEKMKRKQKTTTLPNGLEPMIVKSFSKMRNGAHSNEEPWDPSQFVAKTMENLNNGICNTMDMTLIDVEVKVKASSRGNHVPLVSLMSRLSGKAMIGYPINIEEASSFSLYEHEGGPTTFRGSKGIATAVKWKKRRSPVWYMSQTQSSPGANSINDAKKQSSGPVVVSCVSVAKIFSELFLAIDRV